MSPLKTAAVVGFVALGLVLMSISYYESFCTKGGAPSEAQGRKMEAAMKRLMAAEDAKHPHRAGALSVAQGEHSGSPVPAKTNAPANR